MKLIAANCTIRISIKFSIRIQNHLKLNFLPHTPQLKSTFFRCPHKSSSLSVKGNPFLDEIIILVSLKKYIALNVAVSPWCNIALHLFIYCFWFKVVNSTFLQSFESDNFFDEFEWDFFSKSINYLSQKKSVLILKFIWNSVISKFFKIQNSPPYFYFGSTPIWFKCIIFRLRIFQRSILEINY